MPRIAGVNIPEEKRIIIALTYIYGIGPFRDQEILRQVNITPSKRTKDLLPDEINRLKDTVEKNYKVEGDLRRAIMMDVKRLKDINAYRGLRHIRRLPKHGRDNRRSNRR